MSEFPFNTLLNYFSLSFAGVNIIFLVLLTMVALCFRSSFCMYIPVNNFLMHHSLGPFSHASFMSHFFTSTSLLYTSMNRAMAFFTYRQAFPTLVSNGHNASCPFVCLGSSFCMYIPGLGGWRR